MNVRKLKILALVAAVLCGGGPLAAAETKPRLPHVETPAEREARLAWWREARFGLFIHWGPSSVSGKEISWAQIGKLELDAPAAGEFINGQPVDVPEPLVLQLDLPLDYQVVQRRSRLEGAVRVSGRAPAGTEKLEVQLGGDWLPVEFSKTDGSFDAEVKVAPGGWYVCRTRATGKEKLLATAEVPHVGVGEVFVVAGQSNSANHGEEKLSTQSGLVAAFDGTRWQLAHDPQPGASGGGGSFLPPFGDAIAGRFEVPVGLVACGIGATSVREWLPKGATFPNPPTIVGRVQQLASGQWESKGDAFAMFTARMKPLGPHGFRAVLWHQGESDANQKDPTRTLPGQLYRQYLEQLIRDSRREIGWDAPWFVAQVSYHVPGDVASPDIRAAQKSLWEAGLALEGPDSDALKGPLRERNGQGVHFSGQGLREHAARWVEKVAPWLETQSDAVAPSPLGEVEIWSGDAVPKSAAIPVLKGTEFSVIKPFEFEKDGYRFLHGVALAWHKERLYASFGHNQGGENTDTEEASICHSDDGGKTWSAVTTIDAGDEPGIGVSHGVFHSHQGRLWAFHGAYTGTMQNVHTRCYVLDEASEKWERQGTVIEGGFWPLGEPQRMEDGNWIMSGISVGQGNPAAVAISHGDEVTKWDLVVIPQADGLGNVWGESAVIVDGNRITNIARYGRKPLALVATSDDFGRTWTPSRPANLPMATSKPCAGTLSSGQRYLICTTTADSGGRRSPLTIAVSRPGEPLFSKVFVIRHAEFPAGPGESHERTALAYPCAIEHDGKLYVGYSNSGGGVGRTGTGRELWNNNSAELAVIPVQDLCVEP